MNIVFESSHPLVAHKLTRLRDKDTNPKEFRELIREISALLAYEATLDLEIAPITVETPLAEAQGMELKQPIGLVPILRSGLGMVEGIWGLMPSAEV
ncbi:MAG: uracil phosphoribosyltransferase, partial [Anaerolineales bacterium]|nr:uracil phosphoribosyltransferase [Anaerolineales bacterium]